MYLLLKMVNFQLGHLSLSPRTSTVAPRFQAPRFHVIAPVEERCSQYTPSSSSTMHREGINGIIHLKTALRFPVQQHQAQLIRRNGRGGGFYKFYKWKGGGEIIPHFFVWHWKDFLWICCAMFFDETVQGKENILNTRFTNLKFCKKPAIV